ncbi:hypothetical protein OUZ56_003691 [Daphnia magna]|uniref:HAT C-terminal dimerisation domain-containing protein n=1 Tax=Daphnia magna TaxID=35525 RepID=A0ABR0A9G0_9CRUS|nr:hypothetical protein OUZ56_003691 [Daphnia magna]
MWAWTTRLLFTVSHLPLITSLLDAIQFRLEKMFSDNECDWLQFRIQCSSCRGWKVRKIQGVQNLCLSVNTNVYRASWKCHIPQRKAAMGHRRLVRIIANKKTNEGLLLIYSVTKKFNKQQIEDEVEKYLKFCNNLEHLEEYSTMKLIYKCYNGTLPSSAAVERLFSQAGLIYSPKH